MIGVRCPNPPHDSLKKRAAMQQLKLLQRLGLLVWATAVTAAFGQDGEGSARLLSPMQVVAGSRTRITVEVTVGRSGIPVGGGIALGLHHAASWPGLQIAAPNRPGYMAVTCDTGDTFEVSWHRWAPDGTFAQSHSGSSDARV